MITCNQLLTCLLHPVYYMFTNYCTVLYIQLITGTKELLTSLFHLVDYTWTHSRPVYFILLITGKHTPDLFISSKWYRFTHNWHALLYFIFLITGQHTIDNNALGLWKQQRWWLANNRLVREPDKILLNCTIGYKNICCKIAQSSVCVKIKQIRSKSP